MGYIKENPIEEVHKPEKNKFVGSFYSTEEVNKLIEISKGTKLELPILFACFYGLRRSECVGLRWSAFDFENNTFIIHHNVVSAMVNGKKKLIAKDNLKTAASARTLPLDLGIKKRLMEIKENQNQRKDKEWQEYIMLDESGAIIKPDYITYAFRKLLINNNMRMIRFHDLRHTCASLLLNNGKGNITMKDIQEWLGHSDYKTTANIYAHLDLSSKLQSLKTLSNIIEL